MKIVEVTLPQVRDSLVFGHRGVALADVDTAPHDPVEFLGIGVIMTDSRDDRSEQTDESAESPRSKPGDTGVESERKVRTGEDQAAMNRENDPPA